MHAYKLAGGDDGCYGPSFGPVIADERGEVPSGEGGHILLALREPLQINDQSIRMLAIRPRYVGRSLRSIRWLRATVGIWRVLPDAEAGVSNGLTAENSEYWAVGTCAPL
jgi:hypothetical protein